jgi:hypothetical protein
MGSPLKICENRYQRELLGGCHKKYTYDKKPQGEKPEPVRHQKRKRDKKGLLEGNSGLTL